MTNKRALFNYKVLKNNYAKQKYHWICVAPNGEIRYSSENYTQKHNAVEAIITELKYRVKGVSSYEDCTNEKSKLSKRVAKYLT